MNASWTSIAILGVYMYISWTSIATLGVYMYISWTSIAILGVYMYISWTSIAILGVYMYIIDIYGHFHNNSFSSQLTNGPNEIGCFSLVSVSSLM
jgi:hypothetical protein